MKKNRIYWADNLKGLLIILVVFGHVITNYTSVDEVPFWGRVCDAIYAFHMPAFFIVSGYLYCYSSRNKIINRLFVYKKIISFGVPIIVFSTLYWFVKYVASQISGASIIKNPYSLRDLMLMFLNPIGEYWFLYTLLLITLIEVLIGKIKIHPRLQFVVWFLLLVAVNYIPQDYLYFWQSFLPRILKYGIYFFVGKTIYQGYEKLAKPYFIIGVSIIAISSWVGWFFVDGFLNFVATRFVLSCATTVVLIIILHKCGGTMLGKLGQDSMIIYLLHPYFIVVCKLVLLRFISEQHGLYFVLSTVLSIVFCYIAMFVISKIKYMDFIYKPTKYIKL